MDLTRLRVLVAVAREGSITAAAQALHYAQPSVSHHIARLESDVGVPLVRRVGRGIQLTDAGLLLASRAEEILGRLSSAQDELAAHAGLRTGKVRLAAFPSALATLVPAAAARFAEKHPDLDLALTECEPPEALTALRNGDVDVALVFEHTDATTAAGFTTSTVLDEPLYVVSRADAPIDGRRDELASYADRRWIAGCERCRMHLLASCARAGFTPDIAFETDDYVAAQALVAAGLGVTTLPGLALAASRHAGVRVDRIPDDHRRIVVTTYGRPPAPLPVQAFLDALAESVTAPPWPQG